MEEFASRYLRHRRKSGAPAAQTPTTGEVVAALLLAVWLTAAASFSAAAEPEPIGLQLDSPAPGQRVRRSEPLIEVSGRVAAAELYDSDVVIAIDLSNSALLASGVDVDGDGTVGKTRRWAKDGQATGRPYYSSTKDPHDMIKWERPYRSWTTDPDDTIIHSELIAARFLIEGLAVRKNRIGVLTYTGKPIRVRTLRVRAAVGPPADALEGVDRIRIAVDRTGTDIARALEKAAQMLEEAAPSDQPNRQRIVLLFSDGRPTVPNGEFWAGREALKKAAELAQRKIRVCTFAFGEDAGIEFLSDLARATQCHLVPFEKPHELILDRLADAPAPTRLRIVNLTTGEEAREIRLRPDGAFDATAALVRGENEIQVGATLPDGRRVTTVRRVHYEPLEAEVERDRGDAE